MQVPKAERGGGLFQLITGQPSLYQEAFLRRPLPQVEQTTY
jgi:hypothetical protein